MPFTHSHIFLFPKEAHANVVPEGRALGHGTGGHSILVHGHVKVAVGLHHAACSQDGLGIKTLIRHRLQERGSLLKQQLMRDAAPPDRE